MRVRAIATRCCSPPERVSVLCQALSASPTRSSCSIASVLMLFEYIRALILGPDIRPNAPLSTFSIQVSLPTMLNC